MLPDTDVMIDVARGYAPALVWLASLGGASLDLPGMVAMELLQGCQNLAEQQRMGPRRLGRRLALTAFLASLLK
jgi:predicted nucleic acid-binding protein